jgi:hypothetical protein
VRCFLPVRRIRTDGTARRSGRPSAADHGAVGVRASGVTLAARGHRVLRPHHARRRQRVRRQAPVHYHHDGTDDYRAAHKVMVHAAMLQDIIW